MNYSVLSLVSIEAPDNLSNPSITIDHDSQFELAIVRYLTANQIVAPHVRALETMASKLFKNFMRKDNNPLNIIGSSATGRMGSIGASNTANADISFRNCHLVMRAVQIFCSVVSFCIYCSLNNNFLRANGMYATMVAFDIMMFIMPLIAAGTASLYILKWSRKLAGHHILMIQTVADAIALMLLILMWSSMLNLIGIGRSSGTICPVGISSDCDRYNAALAWGFFTLFAWFAGVCFDVASFIDIGRSKLGAQRLDDTTAANMRRLRANRV